MESYSGARADEAPRFVFWDDQRVAVEVVMGEGVVREAATGRTVARFHVRLATGATLHLEHDLEADTWTAEERRRPQV